MSSILHSTFNNKYFFSNVSYLVTSLDILPFHIYLLFISWTAVINKLDNASKLFVKRKKKIIM